MIRGCERCQLDPDLTRLTGPGSQPSGQPEMHLADHTGELARRVAERTGAKPDRVPGPLRIEPELTEYLHNHSLRITGRNRHTVGPPLAGRQRLGGRCTPVGSNRPSQRPDHPLADLFRLWPGCPEADTGPTRPVGVMSLANHQPSSEELIEMKPRRRHM